MPGQAPPATNLFIGLMSGTSMDGIDAVLVRITGKDVTLIHSYSHAWPQSIQQALIQARDLPDEQLHQLSDLDLELAGIFAEAVTQLLQQSGYRASDIIAIGSHGQTIRHRPDIPNPFSLQLGKAERLASLTGIDVVSDFRTADIQAGGQGAPLVPAFHQAVFRDSRHNRVIVNIGGIANLTILPAEAGLPVTGFDCGPGNTLMDAWIRQHQGQAYDSDGTFAAQGHTHADLLAQMLTDEYFRRPPPKSTGFEYFNLDWLQSWLQRACATDTAPADIQSTLCELTAMTILQAIERYAPQTQEILVCGGGVHNQTLMQRLQALSPCPVQSTQVAGIAPDWVEAMAFAWLAWRHDQGLPGNLPSVTGAKQAVILGRRSKAGC